MPVEDECTAASTDPNFLPNSRMSPSTTPKTGTGATSTTDMYDAIETARPPSANPASTGAGRLTEEEGLILYTMKENTIKYWAHLAGQLEQIQRLETMNHTAKGTVQSDKAAAQAEVKNTPAMNQARPRKVFGVESPDAGPSSSNMFAQGGHGRGRGHGSVQAPPRTQGPPPMYGAAAAFQSNSVPIFSENTWMPAYSRGPASPALASKISRPSLERLKSNDNTLKLGKRIVLQPGEMLEHETPYSYVLASPETPLTLTRPSLQFLESNDKREPQKPRSSAYRTICRAGYFPSPLPPPLSYCRSTDYRSFSPLPPPLMVPAPFGHDHQQHLCTFHSTYHPCRPTTPIPAARLECLGRLDTVLAPPSPATLALETSKTSSSSPVSSMGDSMLDNYPYEPIDPSPVTTYDETVLVSHTDFHSDQQRLQDFFQRMKKYILLLKGILLILKKSNMKETKEDGVNSEDEDMRIYDSYNEDTDAYDNEEDNEEDDDKDDEEDDEEENMPLWESDYTDEDENDDTIERLCENLTEGLTEDNNEDEDMGLCESHQADKGEYEDDLKHIHKVFTMSLTEGDNENLTEDPTESLTEDDNEDITEDDNKDDNKDEGMSPWESHYADMNEFEVLKQICKELAQVFTWDRTEDSSEDLKEGSSEDLNEDNHKDDKGDEPSDFVFVQNQLPPKPSRWNDLPMDESDSYDEVVVEDDSETTGAYMML